MKTKAISVLLMIAIVISVFLPILSAMPLPSVDAKPLPKINTDYVTNFTFNMNGSLSCHDDDYTNSISGTGVKSAHVTEMVGWFCSDEMIYQDYFYYKTYISFDTSVILNSNVTNVNLYMDLDVINKTGADATDFSVVVYSVDYGASLTTADWNVSTTFIGEVFNTSDGIGTHNITVNTTLLNPYGFTQFIICNNDTVPPIPNLDDRAEYVNISTFALNVSYTSPVSHAPIRIDNNTGFNATNGVSYGNGTVLNPYIISNYVITGSNLTPCIYIANTTAYFEVSNCLLWYAGGSLGISYYMNASLNIRNVTNGSISNIVANNSRFGLFIHSGDNITINTVNMSSNSIGMYVYQSPDTVVEDCIFNDNANNGMYVVQSDNSLLTNITMINNGNDGMMIDNSTSCNVVDSNATDNGRHGIGNVFSNETIIDNCDFWNNNWYSIYTYYSDNVSIDSCVAELSSNGINIYGSFNRVNNSIIADMTAYGINVDGKQNNITYCDIHDNLVGIYIGDATTVIGCNVEDNTGLGGAGIYIYGDENYIIENNTLHSNVVGCSITGDNNHIYHNDFITNTLQVSDSGNNYFNTTYAGGGNYYHNYSLLFANDSFSGVNQDSWGADGIIDDEFVIDADSFDYHPLKKMFWRYNLTAYIGEDMDGFANSSTSFSSSQSYLKYPATNYTWKFKYNPVSFTWFYFYGANPTYTFIQSGEFNITLTITNNIGQTDVDNVLINISDMPNADAGGKYYGYINSTKALDGSGSVDPDGTITNYTWIVNGTTYLYGVNPTLNTVPFIAGTYNVSLQITDNESFMDWDNTTITLQIWVFANAGVDQTGRFVVYHINGSGSTGEISNYTWTFVYNGITYHRYTVAFDFYFNAYGNFTLTLNVTDGNYTDSDTMVVRSYVASANAGADDSCGHKNYTFNGTGSTGLIVFYTWRIRFGASIYASLYGATPIYNCSLLPPYIFNVTLQVDTVNYSYFDTMQLTVGNVAPTANAGADQVIPESYCIFNGTLSIDDMPLVPHPGYQPFKWTFVYDSYNVTTYGNISGFYFYIPGVYVVMLTVNDSDGVYGYDNMTVTVSNFNPVADAGADQIGHRGLIWLNPTNSSDIDGYIVSYVWNYTYNGAMTYYYGSGNVYFMILGNYYITLNVTDDDGAWDTDTCWVNITGINPIPYIYPISGSLKGNHTLDGSASYDIDGTITNWTWEIRENGGAVYGYAYGEITTFNFADELNYNITLTVEDDDTLTNSTESFFNVTFLAPTADFDITVNNTYKGIKTLNGAISTDADGVIANYTWEFDYNGSTITLYDIAPTYDFQINSTYYVNLTVTDDDSKTDIIMHSFDIIWHMPTSVISDINPDNLYQGNITNTHVVSFSGAESTDLDGTILNYTWNLTIAYNNQTPFTLWFYGESFDYTFNSTGNMTLSLTVTDDSGLIDTAVVSYGLVNRTALEETFDVLLEVFVPMIFIFIILWVVYKIYKKISRRKDDDFKL
jgi:parallel beta-helix repeat protein